MNNQDRLIKLLSEAHQQYHHESSGFPKGSILIPSLSDHWARLVAEAVIAAGWRPRDEWLMGIDAPSKTYLIARGPGPNWHDIVTGLTFDQANAIVVEHNRVGSS